VLRWAAAVLAVGVLVTATIGMRSPAAGSAGPTPVGAGAVLWRSGGVAVVVIDGRATAEGLLSSLRSAGVERLDVLVVRTTADRAVGVAARANERWPSLVVLVPRGVDGLAGAVTPPTGGVMDVGALRLRFASTTNRLEVTVIPNGPPTRRRSPTRRGPREPA
jgi:hypothetical protein